jgi:GNAT superfamily N-acetyltransferase
MASMKPDSGDKDEVGRDITIVRIRGGDDNAHAAWALLTELRPRLSLVAFRRLLADSQEPPVTYEAAMVEQNCVALIGWRLHNDSRIGRHAYVADLVVAAGHRGRGLGRIMINSVADAARQLNCITMVLDSGNANTAAHQFYETIGFARTAVQFELSLDG